MRQRSECSVCKKRRITTGEKPWLICSTCYVEFGYRPEDHSASLGWDHAVLLHQQRAIGHANRPGWWVFSTARPSGHRSAMGPYLTAAEAGAWADSERSSELWRNISIQFRRGTRR